MVSPPVGIGRAKVPARTDKPALTAISGCPADEYHQLTGEGHRELQSTAEQGSLFTQVTRRFIAGSDQAAKPSWLGALVDTVIIWMIPVVAVMLLATSVLIHQTSGK
jgi:hypothetical protein